MSVKLDTIFRFQVCLTFIFCVIFGGIGGGLFWKYYLKPRRQQRRDRDLALAINMAPLLQNVATTNPAPAQNNLNENLAAYGVHRVAPAPPVAQAQIVNVG